MEEITIMINASSGDPAELIKKMAVSRFEVKAKAYYNAGNGTYGIVIFQEDSTHEILDVFFNEEPKEIQKLAF